MSGEREVIRWFDDLGADDGDIVGGKNASLGEMLSALADRGVRVPSGFATTAEAYRDFLRENGIREEIEAALAEMHEDQKSLQKAGRRIRRAFLRSNFSQRLRDEIEQAYRDLCDEYDRDEVDVAVRSSATAEDLPSASFAGQQETFLNVSGVDELLDACRRCYASLFTDRAISYRETNGFDHMKVALSVGVQKMVRSDKASAGVMFSIHTETGYPDVVVINAAWGLGENVVNGSVNPDEYLVFKPLLADESFKPIVGKSLGAKEKKMIYAGGGSERTRNVDTSESERRRFALRDEEVLRLARWACTIEDHYGRPMDMEWAKDGETGEIYIVQARPETVHAQQQAKTFKHYELKESGERLVAGVAVGQGISTGKAIVIRDPEEFEKFEEGAILVTGMTDPDWVPVMKRAAGIVTDHGGRTSHAAIVSRELGLPALVGCGEATHRLQSADEITLSCAEGDEGYVYAGALEYEESEEDLEDLPSTQTRLMMNVASPAGSLRWWRLPAEGIGLARMEFIIGNHIRIHPLALIHPDRVEDEKQRREIERLTRGYDDRREYFVDRLARGIALIAAPQHPDPVLVRMSDFKTNEYAGLLGGKAFEPEEANPMLGWRGASRYYSDEYRAGFDLECMAIRRVRDEIGLRNVAVMIPFCRTLDEADRVLAVMAENGLERGRDGLEIYVMAEIPSNILLAGEFADRFDGFSIGTNDLTQLVLGTSRDSDRLSEIFDARNEAVKRMIRMLIRTAHEHHTKVGICGQAPSDHPEFAEFLVEEGIDSISLNPDSVLKVKRRVAEVERRLGRRGEAA